MGSCKGCYSHGYYSCRSPLSLTTHKLPDHSVIKPPSPLKMLKVGFQAAAGMRCSRVNLTFLWSEGQLGGVVRSLKWLKKRVAQRHVTLRDPATGKTRPHYFLGLVGVLPGLQRQGIGSELLSPVLQAAENVRCCWFGLPLI
jgi:GNAT superfamily N-acetyltransferase